MSTSPLLDTNLPLPLVRHGKVRDVYAAGADHLLIVATDRISAFDYVLGSGVPDKGRILTQISAFWFEHLADVVSNHLVSLEPADFPAEVRAHADVLRGRTMLVRRTEPLPVECVARGYLSGSGWKDYRRTGAVCGIALPAGLVEAARLPAPIFTPATKAESGHDENISEAQAGARIGHELVTRLRELTLELYARGSRHAQTAGIIVADTKFEFGLLRAGSARTNAPGASANQGQSFGASETQGLSSGASANQGQSFGASANQGQSFGASETQGLSSGASATQGPASGAAAAQGVASGAAADQIILIDEVLTPDSSRFWPADRWAPGGPQPSYDKQFVRDYLERIAWNKQPPVPTLPAEVVERTRRTYLEAFERLSGRRLR